MFLFHNSIVKGQPGFWNINGGTTVMIKNVTIILSTTWRNSFYKKIFLNILGIHEYIKESRFDLICFLLPRFIMKMNTSVGLYIESTGTPCTCSTLHKNSGSIKAGLPNMVTNNQTWLPTLKLIKIRRNEEFIFSFKLVAFQVFSSPTRSQWPVVMF